MALIGKSAKKRSKKESKSAKTAARENSIRVLRKAVREREALLATVSHDLKTPLSAILLLIDLMTKKKAACDDSIILALRKNAEKMLDLVGRYLDVATIRAGHLGLKRQPEDVCGIVDDSLTLLKPLAKAKSIEITKEFYRNDLVVPCDRQRIAQVFSNLIGNAIKFIPNNGKIRLKCQPGEKEVCFIVSDNGPGLPRSVLPFVFEEFVPHSANEKKNCGNGLGLSIVKGIVDAHGGRIWVESREGEGASFFFTLPCGVPVSGN